MIEIVLDGEFTTLNEYILAERGHYRKAAEIKKFETQRVRLETIGVLPVPLEYYPLVVTFHWYRKNQKSDPDNVSFAKKFILDGLQVAGIIKGDGWKEIAEFYDYFYAPSTNPHVTIRFERS